LRNKMFLLFRKGAYVSSRGSAGLGLLGRPVRSIGPSPNLLHTRRWRSFRFISRRQISTSATYERRHSWRFRALVFTAVSFVGLNRYVSKAGTDILSLSDEGLPLSYDPEQIERFWAEHPRIVLWRLRQLSIELIPFFSRWWIESKLYGFSENDLKRKASVLRKKLTDLGPAFIKLGQLLSTRPDILPQEVLSELQTLCDAVPPFPTSKAIEIFLEEMKPSSILQFENFNAETKPIAAASLGQVYKLKMLNSDNYVAVKIQRPDMIRTVSLDLYLLRKYAAFVEAFKSGLMEFGILSRRKQFDLDLVDCFARGSYSELDYCNEARNQELFLQDLVPRLRNRITVPKVYNEFTTRKILTTEWIEGKQLAQSSPEVIKRLVPVGVECFLEQLLQMGVFHCDPHAGNLLVDERERLVLIDFGLCAEVPRPDTKNLTTAVVHLMEGDVEGLLDDAINLSFLPTDVDKKNLLVELQRIFADGKLKAMVESNSKYQAVEQRRKKFEDVSRDLNSVFYRYPFLVPDYFALITRALIVLEGIAVTGDPAFDIFEAAYPYAFQYSLSNLGTDETLALGKAFARKGGTRESWMWNYVKRFI